MGKPNMMFLPADVSQMPMRPKQHRLRKLFGHRHTRHIDRHVPSLLPLPSSIAACLPSLQVALGVTQLACIPKGATLSRKRLEQSRLLRLSGGVVGIACQSVYGSDGRQEHDLTRPPFYHMVDHSPHTMTGDHSSSYPSSSPRAPLSARQPEPP